ncbi:hypothetical protein LK994_09485 [Ferruginibacter lapsinanis]|uniref:hypothetical protein n=1 Tax=Ferruginibacter lapsinanis TaxID=563172 RepID=UPI001E3D82D5|nr:hypothetical protein [Ferruginibacter lapsinanis]UEG48868.1 hypothetical protein LK994_09485 [Ferruginibacter lapsinanis]
MKKVLLVFDGTNFSAGAFEFARVLNEKQNILLIGAFLPEFEYSNLWGYSGGSTVVPSFVPVSELENTEVVTKNIERFKSLCIKNGIEFRVHHDFVDFTLLELKMETRFSDLLIIGSETFYDTLGMGSISDYLQKALHEVECPVVVVPEKFEFPKSNILAYDGGESSVYAIKQFTYLFPELTANKTLLAYAKENDEEELPDEVNIEELAARHFSNLTLSKSNIDPHYYFNRWLLEGMNAIFVTGAYGRSGISRLFHKSFVNDIIKEHRIPVFIAHR